MSDLSQNDNFRVLPDWAQKHLEGVTPTGKMNGDDWHETQFEIDGIFVQVAVVNGKYVPLPQSQVDQISRIVKIWSKEDLGG